jgi:hypothetical protein
MDMEESQILKFYRGEENRSGHLLRDIIEKWNDEDWERGHDFIQWVFPTDEESKFHPDAPVMTCQEAIILGEDPELRQKVLASLERFKGFLKLETGPHWWAAPNHNLLRISRAIRCLALLGLKEEAADLRDRCTAILKTSSRFEEVKKSLEFWDFNLVAEFNV